MTNQLYLQAIDALRQRVEAAGEGEELHVLDMLAEEIVKALARFNVAQRAESATDTATSGDAFGPHASAGTQAEPPPEVVRFLAAEEAEYAAEPPPPLVVDAWAWRSAGLLDDDDLIALEDDNLFAGGDWDPEEDDDEEDNSDLWEDNPDEAHEYALEDDEEVEL